jgi:hypothetical protein
MAIRIKVFFFKPQEWSFERLTPWIKRFERLQKSLPAREPEILGVQNDPEFDSLRSDPRLQQLVQAIGLTR